MSAEGGFGKDEAEHRVPGPLEDERWLHPSSDGARMYRTASDRGHRVEDRVFRPLSQSSTLVSEVRIQARS
jgi:hypothetical protein